MVIAAALLGELVDTFKVCVLARNALAIALIIKPPFLFGGDARVPLVGVIFVLVQCTGSAVGAVFQRRLCDQPVEPLLFWGFLANVIYWFPPGVSPPRARVPFLWPSTAETTEHISLEQTLGSLIYPFLAGMFECVWYIFAGYGMKYMTAANFFFIMVPLALAMSCVASAIVFHETIDRFSFIAFVIIGFGFVFDRWWETRSKFEYVAVPQEP
jgi:drug/metabolite transporter (DMT)-like permease